MVEFYDSRGTRWSNLRKRFNPDQPRDEDGKWTDTGASTSDGRTKDGVETGMKPASPAEFVAARDRSSRQQFLSPNSAEDLANHKLLTSADGTVGISVDPKGDIQNVFNNGGPKGGAAKAMVAAIANGGRTLDCYDGYLTRLYSRFGFAEDSRMKFNPDYAPAGWDHAKYDSPDIVFMSWRGYVDGQKGALEAAAKDRSTWKPPARSTIYDDDWDAAKERSRANAAR